VPFSKRRADSWLAAIAAAAVIAAGAGIPRVSAQTPATTIPSDRNAVYMCPMHPDVRGRAGETCSRCGMTLVRASAADYRPYRLDVDIVPAAIRPGRKARVRFLVRRPGDNSIVRQFEPMHERLFHLFVVSQDLEYFAHIHPALQSSGALDVDIDVPKPGAYRLVADFLPADGPPQLAQRAFVTAGYAGPLSDGARLTPDVADKVQQNTRVRLSMSPAVAGREQLITFDLFDESSGAPVNDLELYLGAVGHLFEANSDLSAVFHDHPVPELSGASGPRVVFQVLFPRPGIYRVWAQFQRHAKVITTAFTIPVAAHR